MPTYGSRTTHSHYWGKLILACCSINLLKSHGLSNFKAKMSFSIPLSSNYRELKKQAEKNLDAYKLTVEENLLVQYSKAFTTYTKKMVLLSIARGF